jgi:hypothetical protein
VADSAPMVDTVPAVNHPAPTNTAPAIIVIRGPTLDCSHPPNGMLKANNARNTEYGVPV